MQRSVRSSSLATVLYSMKNLITCFQLSQMCSSQLLHLEFCLGNRNLLDYCVTVQCHKNAKFAALDFIVLNLMYHALTSA